MTDAFSTPGWFRELLGVSGVLAAEDEDDELPLTFRLAAMGTAFAAHDARLTPRQKQRVFGILEEVQVSGSEYDGTAVATGFFEALLNAWDEGFDLQGVWEYVGPESRAYCLAWNRFTGVETPAWMR
ncbi:DUF7674 family protein [Streptomyces geranii]|uniref:DUF7674 family protein n=1 Tax=Streptomyces geranii TaxID=2058923 RepID=UPI000D03287B|nr:hypothetical protein [Streptomyces geranii]